VGGVCDIDVTKWCAEGGGGRLGGCRYRI